MHYFITSPCSFTPPLVQARAPKWTFFNHHFTVVFWLIQSLKAHKFTVCGRHGRQHETPHIILCAAWKLISFTLWPNKSFPRLKQNANSTLLRFCVTVKTSVPEKNEAGSFESEATRGQNWPLTPSRMRWAPGVTSDQWWWSQRFPRSMSAIKGV